MLSALAWAKCRQQVLNIEGIVVPAGCVSAAIDAVVWNGWLAARAAQSGIDLVISEAACLCDGIELLAKLENLALEGGVKDAF
jgi:hypothetical protein